MKRAILQDITNVTNKNIKITIRKTGQRKKLLKWIYEVTSDFNYSNITYARAVYIIDDYVRVSGIDFETYQLVGITSLFIAAKFEERRVNKISEYVAVTDSAFTREEILDMEKLILKTIDFQIIYMLPHHYVTVQELDNFTTFGFSLSDLRDIFYVTISIILSNEESKNNAFGVFNTAKNMISKMLQFGISEQDSLFYMEKKQNVLKILKTNRLN